MVTPGPDKNIDTGTLLNEFTNASINAAKIPEVIFGKSIVAKALFFVHPSVHAASSIETSTCSILEPTDTNHIRNTNEEVTNEKSR